MNFEMECTTQVMKEFFIHKPEQMYCIIMLKSGQLKINGCSLSLDGIFSETYRKVPCVAVLPKQKIHIHNCNFKGDTTNGAETTGILAYDSDVHISKSVISNFKCGGIMIQSEP